MSSDFGHMLSVGVIHFEVRFCTCRKGGCTPLGDSAWWLLQLAVEKRDQCLVGFFGYFLAQTGVENAPFTLSGLHWYEGI